MEFYAHMRDVQDGETERQTVKAHLVGTAERAARCLATVGLEKTAYLAGLLHDMGKYTADFQRYLAEGGNRGSVIHTFQGCRYMSEKHGGEWERIYTSEYIAYAIGAHHGLFDCVASDCKIGLKHRAEKDGVSYEEAKRSFFGEISEKEVESLFDGATKEIGRIIGQICDTYADDDEYAFEAGLLARLILSAVIEGDRRDTAAFMSGVTPPDFPEDMTPLWASRLAFAEEKLAKFPCDTPIAKARHEISEACREFAEREPGIYRLNVPTGGGKTLSSLRYALAHARRFNKRRIIFTSPLLSILEQNAAVIREYVGDDGIITEHHSNIVQTDKDNDKLDERELLVQSWDSPIIITTLVQLLCTVLDGKTTCVRRFYALCDSVIVIDEVQTVPAKMLTLFNLAVRFLAEVCGATVILCSATQPSLDKAKHPIPTSPEEIVPYDEGLWEIFRRTEIKELDSRRLEDMPELIRSNMESTDSLLVVCNQKKQAAYLFCETRSQGYKSFHLSAAMCTEHRRNVLSKVREALSRHEKVLCVATQVIEAGVDISFDTVIRLAAGMDSVVQSAGRCNRNGESDSPKPVYVVNCSDENLGMLRDIRRGKDASIALLYEYKTSPESLDNSLFSDKAIDYYYEKFYNDMDENEQDFYIKEKDATVFDLMAENTKYADERCENADDYCLHQAFKTAGQHFSVFDEDTTDVIVPYGEGKKLIEELCSKDCLYNMKHRQEVLDKLNGFTVSLYQYQKKRLEEGNALKAVCDGCALVLAEGFYDENTGLTESQNKLTLWEV